MARVAVIGAGYWGANLLRNFNELGALAGICDSDSRRLKALSPDYPNATACSDANQVLADDGIDAVAIATPVVTHGALADAALEAGKHVFVEKPLCLDLDEGKALAEKAEARGLVLMVGHLLLYHPAYVSLKRLVDNGELGKLRYIYSNRLSLGKIRREENALWSFAPHDISMILDLTDDLPLKVSANGGAWLSPDIADTTLSHLTFEGGVQAHIFVSWLHPYKDHRLVVVGSEAMVGFHDMVSGPEKLLLYRHSVEWEGAVPAVNRAEATPIPYDDAEPLRRECQHFLDCVATGARPRTDAGEGLRVLAVLDACQAALASGAPVDVKRMP